MNALEFFANVDIERGATCPGEEVIVLLPQEDNKMVYFRTFREGDGFFYEYITLTCREKKYYSDYLELKYSLENLPVKEQYELLQKLKTIEVDYNPSISYDELNGWYVDFATYEKYPLYSVRGTCSREKECNSEPFYCRVHDEPCCSGKKVGCSDTSSVKNPEYHEFFIELVLWMASCPDMDVLYVMHDFPPVIFGSTELDFEFAFLLKDKKITYIEDKVEIERLYKEYHKKYPCDTSEVENMMNSWDADSPDFHF